MYRALKLAALRAGRRTGAFNLVRDSRWRRNRLLILCYHGVSLDDEHRWNPGLYMSPEWFEARLQLLKSGGYTVVPFDEAVTLLREGQLPPRSVTLTFDDGLYDFYAQIAPMLRAYGFPALVYLTTYYCEFNRAIFNLICPYQFWKARNRTFHALPLTGEDVTCELASERGRRAAWLTLARFVARERLDATEKDALAERLAQTLGIDYEVLRQKRLLHLMNTTEVSELARQGIAFQLHTHRHRTPRDASLFDREIIDNRTRIERFTDTSPQHFCYPSGEYRPDVVAWLDRLGVATATTCDPGLASRRSPRLLLPRFVDTMAQPSVVFEGWLSGAASWLPRRASYATGSH